MFAGEGLADRPYLIRRRDGRVLAVSQMLNAVVESIEGERDVDEVAREVSVRTGRRVEREDIYYLLENKLRPLGVLGGEVRASAGSGLAVRSGAIPDRAVRAACRLLRGLFNPVVVAAVLDSLLAVEAWLL